MGTRKRKAGRKGLVDVNFFMISNIDCKYPFLPPKETNSCKILEKKKTERHSLLQYIFHPRFTFYESDFFRDIFNMINPKVNID